QAKEKALYDYDKVRSKLDDFIFTMRMDDAVKRNAIKEQSAQNMTTVISPYFNQILDMLGGKIDDVLPQELEVLQ
ncbi:MAG: hypothetical protein IKJ79_00530, partial [Bacteroidaceae bacterium]|nr:hypothetical protein [Bacteroidaceae bacterium]